MSSRSSKVVALSAVTLTSLVAGGAVATASSDNSGVDRTGQTLKIGLVNMDALIPEFGAGAKAAIAAINADGGINGAQIEIVECTVDGSPEASIDCANQLVEADVAFAYTGIDIAVASGLEVYSEAQIPHISSNGWAPVALQDPNSFVLHAASSAYLVAPMVTAKDLGVENFTFIFEDNAYGRSREGRIVELGNELFGFNTSSLPVSAEAPDWAAAVATLQANDVEAVWGQLSEAGCIGLVGAAAAAGYDGAVFAGSCSFFLRVLPPEVAAGAYTQGDLWSFYANDMPDEIRARMDDFATHMADAGFEELTGSFASAAYSAWYELRPILESIPDDEITSESVATALNRGVTTPGWLGPDLQCGAAPWPTEPQACTGATAVFQIVLNDDGSIGAQMISDFENRFELTQ